MRHPYFSNISTQPLCFNLLKLRCPKLSAAMVVKKGGLMTASRNPRPETWDGNKNKQLFNLWSHSGINWSIWFSRILSLFCSSDWPVSGWSGNLPEMGGCFSEPSSDNAGLIADAEIPFLCRFSWIFEDQIKAFSFWCFHLVEGRNVTQLGFCSWFFTAFDVVLTVPSPFLPLIWMCHLQFGFKRLQWSKGDNTWNLEASRVAGVDGDHLRMRHGFIGWFLRICYFGKNRKHQKTIVSLAPL